MLLWLLLIGTPLGAWADRDVNQLQFGKQTIEVASDEVITFYDPWGTEDIDDQNSYNAQSLTVFKPAEAGKSVQITFETIDLYQYSNAYFLYMNLYDGIADSDDAFTWATSASGVTSSSSLAGMSGTLIVEKINNDNKPSLPAVYTSGTADGALSVGFMHRNSNECEGWVAKVKVVTLENQTITGAGSNYDGIGGRLTTKQNVALAHAYVTATGVMNPDPVTAIYFTLTQNEGVVDPAALKLFRGDKQVEATVSAVSQSDNQYVFTLSEAPAEGTTTFTIRGDILGKAAVGAKVQVDINKVATEGQPDGITPFTAAQSVVVENPALVTMSATPQTVTVGDIPLQFYDEGGKDGGILSKTNGQVTFLSGVEGKKVAVDFTKNSIWHGTLYNQELRIYNGREVTAEALIRTLQQGETALVRSTADDGSLTVVLYSDASNSVAADGFEATVSLFTPQPMDFNTVTMTAASEETVCAGDADQAMLTVNVNTRNTEPAMQVTKMSFATENTFTLITKALLYYGTAKVGETAVNADAFEITLDTPLTLTEGDNLFTLKYDISNEALNDQVVKAKVVSATALVNNAEKTATVSDVSPSERTVLNLVLSHANQGTVTKTVNGSLAFNTQTANSYSSYCEAGTDDRINVFVPKHEGMVAQIDFSEFNVQYASSSYGTKSKLRIYAGQGTEGTLLWELNDHAQESVGPDHIVRSNAADGALTVVFNPNSSYSYYYKGFKATVSEYLPKDMEVSAVEATQTTTADVSIGATEQELLTVNVKTEGEMNVLSLNGMKLSLKGTETNSSKVSVWQGENKLGEIAAAAEVTIAFDEAVELAEGDNLFAVKVNIAADATENSTIDAALVSVHIGSADVVTVNGDPEGARTLKNMILMTEGNHGTFSLVWGQQTSIYDDGGPDGDGADGVEATLTLAPAGEADCIKLTDMGISFAYTAHLYIYKGGEVNDENLIIDVTGSSAKFEPIISDAAVDGGKLTIKYVGKGSYSRPNFAIQAEGYKKTDVVVTKVTTEDISVSEVLKGQTDVKMLKIAVEAKGELAPAIISAFNINGISGESVSASHIYTTGTTTTFSANNEFSGEYAITNSDTYYFWLTYDVKADAEVGQTATATVSSIVVNGSAVDITEPATATITVASGKSGSYTVGASADYATIQEAIDDMGTLGMEGPVVLKIKAGEYAEKVRVPYIKGMGAVNTLTLESESGERDVKVFHNKYTTGGYSDDQHKKDYGVITLYQASYVTLKNLEVYTTDKAYKAVVMVKDESRHVTIDNCYLHAPACTASSGEDVVLVGHTIIDEENKNNDYLTVRNSLLEGGKMGVSMGGTNYVALPKEVGGVIEGNTFKNNAQKAIYVMDELGVKIKNNTIIIEADAPTKMSVGVLDMQLRDAYSEATEITGNIFDVAPSSYVSVMNFRQLEGTAEAPVLIANNVINLASLNASYNPIKFNGTKMKNVNLVHNTFRMTGTNGGAAFWASSKLDDGYGNIHVVNNIIQNETTGYAVNLYNDANLGSDKFNFQNNIIYTAGDNFFRAASSTSGDFAAFVEATGATGCVNAAVTFFEGTAEPYNDLDGSLLTALPLAYVTTDITGKERPATGITIGAYEYDNTDVAPTMVEGYPKVNGITASSAILTLKADVAGNAYVLMVPTSEVEETPSQDEVLAAEKTMTFQANSEAMLTLNDLTAETAYTVFVVMKHKRGKMSEVYTTAFTSGEVPTEAPVIELAVDDQTLLLLVEGGKAPYQITWKQANGTIMKQETLDALPDEPLSLDVMPILPTDYIVTLKDKQAREAVDTARVVVTGEPWTADFEDTYELNQLGFWNGPGLIHAVEPYYYYGYFSGNNLQSTFLSGTYQFNNSLNKEYNSWTGFAVSNSTEHGFNFADYDVMMYNNCVGGGYGGSQCYAVSYNNSEVRVLGNPNGEQLRGMMITNSAWNVDYYLNGDESQNVTDDAGNAVAIGEGFHESDYFCVTITGYDSENRPTASFDYYLADYRTATPEEQRGYVNDWQWVDLSRLGTVSRVTFSAHGSRQNAYGAVTPEYFCIDNFNCENPTPDCIQGFATTEQANKCYDLGGRRLSKQVKGLNIVRKGDGQVHKTVVK